MIRTEPDRELSVNLQKPPRNLGVTRAAYRDATPWVNARTHSDTYETWWTMIELLVDVPRLLIHYYRSKIRNPNPP